MLQTAWYRSRRDDYLRLTRFFGTLLVINVAIAVVTGIVQEFQFGMKAGRRNGAAARGPDVRGAARLGLHPYDRRIDAAGRRVLATRLLGQQLEFGYD